MPASKPHCTAGLHHINAVFRVVMLSVMILCCAPVTLAQTQSTDHLTLRINVLGLKSNQGQVVAKLFLEGDDVFGPTRDRQIKAIVEKQASLTFSALKAGRYAVMVFHDLNSNNDIDHNFLRLPAEPLGYSNGFQLTLFSGLPDSHKLAFDVNASTSSIDIAVK